MKNWIKAFSFLLGVGLLIKSYPFVNSDSKSSTIKLAEREQRTLAQSFEPKEKFPSNQSQLDPSQMKDKRLKATPKTIQESIEALNQLRSCYEKEGSCQFPQSDPKSEYFAIGQKIKNSLLKLQDRVSRNQIKDESIAEIARNFLKVPDGHVKEAALHLISTQEPSPKNLQAILDEIINYHDAKLIAHAMLELQRYLGTSDEAIIHPALAQALTQGSPLVSEQVSRFIFPFLNTKSLTLYRSTLNRLNIGSGASNKLRNALNEHSKQQRAA